jgi:DNA polymerase elongation subunit (family B)
VKHPQPRILILDIETFPNIGYIWGKYDQNVIRYTQEKCIATFAAKWLGEKKIISRALPDYAGYKPGSYDDKKITKDLWDLFDQADVIVAHNGDDFDIKYCQARFIFHGMLPPSPIKSVDTKKVAKRAANFNSNKLDDLGQLLGLGRKLKTDFDLWEGCIKGERKFWRQMVEYNEYDVVVLEKLYLRLLPWVKNHPNFTAISGGMCPKCNSQRIQWRGVQIATTRTYNRFQCQDCGGWGRTVRSSKSQSTEYVNVAG